MVKRWRGATAAAIVAAVALVAACGGSSAQKSDAERWADSLCTSVNTWQTSLKEAANSVADPASVSADSLTSAVNKAVNSTRTFVDDMKALEPPQTKASVQAKQILAGLDSSLAKSANDLDKALKGQTETPAQLLTTVSSVAAVLAQMSTDVSDSLTQLEQIDSGTAELQQALEKSPECKALRGQ